MHFSHIRVNFRTPLFIAGAFVFLMPDRADSADIFAALLQSRQTILPKRLVAPGPNDAQLAQILGAAAHAPDHGQLLPWRFVIIPADARSALGNAFAEALLSRDASASAEQVEQAREKAGRAPLLMLVVVDTACGNPGVDLAERMLSAGCAVQNMLLMATALGFGSALTSGQAMHSVALRSLFALEPGAQAVCFLSVGTVARGKAPCARPVYADYVQTLDPQRHTPQLT